MGVSELGRSADRDSGKPSGRAMRLRSSGLYSGLYVRVQDAHSIKDIMKAQGIADFRAPPPIPKFVDTVEAIDELPSYDSFEPPPDDF